MTLKQIEVFLAIARTQSFSKGGDITSITQSTASQHIIALEDELGVRLFDRGRGGALLTEAGKIFALKASKIIAECDESRSAIRRFLGMEDVVLRVSASNTPATCLIPDNLGKFQEGFPGVRIEISQGDSRSAIRQLTEEVVELAFTGGQFDIEGIHYEPMGHDQIICVVSPDFPGGGKRSLSQGELCKVPLIVREQGSGTQKAVYEALAKTWINPDSMRIRVVLGSGEAVLRAVLKGTGYAFVSSIFVSDSISRGYLKQVRIPGLNITRKFYAAWRDGRELSPAAVKFLEIMLK